MESPWKDPVPTDCLRCWHPLSFHPQSQLCKSSRSTQGIVYSQRNSAAAPRPQRVRMPSNGKCHFCRNQNGMFFAMFCLLQVSWNQIKIVNLWKKLGSHGLHCLRVPKVHFPQTKRSFHALWWALPAMIPTVPDVPGPTSHYKMTGCALSTDLRKNRLPVFGSLRFELRSGLKSDHFVEEISTGTLLSIV